MALKLIKIIVILDKIGFKIDTKYGSGHAIWFADDIDSTDLYGPFKISMNKNDIESLTLKDCGVISDLWQMEDDLYSGKYDGVKYELEDNRNVTYYAISNITKLNTLKRY